MKLLISIVFASFVFAVTASAQTDVRVTNKVGDAVAVKSVDAPARHGFQLSTSINPATPAVVPAGKVFAVEFVSGQVRIPSATGATTPCKFMQLSFVMGGSDIDVAPVSMGTAPSVSNDINFVTISQPIKAYLPAGSEVGPASLSLASSCSGFPTFSHIVFSGYLIND
ncbi:MAG: hypothetical protein ABI878_01460 [Acidobacteriota bacterium]